MYSKLLDIVVDITKKKATKTKYSVKDLILSVQNSYYNYQEYINAGGYPQFYESILKLEEEGLVRPIKSSKLNNLEPSLHQQYWLFGKKHIVAWSDSIIFMVSDELDISKYRSLPFLQTEDNLTKLLSLYRFMKTKDRNNWINREERSLMIFGDEKFLNSSKGKSFLNRINLTLSDLKIEEKQAKFECWTAPDYDSKSEVRVLIIEGHATYRTFKKQLINNEWMFEKRPDMLVFGQGNGILSSFPYIDAFIKGKKADIKYAGDIDPSGLSIYYSLVNRFPEYSIQLALDIYNFMISTNHCYPQNTNQVMIDGADTYFKSQLPTLYHKIIPIFSKRLRIPQEVINFDTI